MSINSTRFQTIRNPRVMTHVSQPGTRGRPGEVGDPPSPSARGGTGGRSRAGGPMEPCVLAGVGGGVSGVGAGGVGVVIGRTWQPSGPPVLRKSLSSDQPVAPSPVGRPVALAATAGPGPPRTCAG